MDWLEIFGLAPHDCLEIGSIYGRLTILATGVKPGTYRYYAVCQCSCGSEPKMIRIDGIRSGIVQGCGCIQKARVTKHGNWDHKLYGTWKAMHERCYDPKNKRFNRYGGRGITVCDRWHDLNNFIEDMYPSYSKGLQLDRIDNDKEYYPENCHWTDRYGQAQNKSSNIILTHNGQTLCLAEWASITGIPYGTLWERIVVLKWSTERALTTPSMDAHERLAIARSSRRNSL